MDSPLKICIDNLNSLLALIEEFVDQSSTDPVSRADRENISAFEINYKNFQARASASSSDPEAAIDSAKNAAIHALALGNGVTNAKIYHEKLKLIGHKLQRLAQQFIEEINSSQPFMGPYKISVERMEEQTNLNGELGALSNLERHVVEQQAKLRSEVDSFERGILKGQDAIEKLIQNTSDSHKLAVNDVESLRQDIEVLRRDISGLHESILTEADKASKVTSDAVARNNEVYNQIDELLGQTASKVLIVDYANTADAERKSANSMRIYSLFCMALTGVVLSFALYESLSNDVDWKHALFKALTAIALSVPAAYLARESAKHRSQEHINRRISLDLRAITPYIATLSSDEQQKIKSEVALKIFGVHGGGNSSPDSYPLNTQELMKSLIDKIPTVK